MKRILMTNGLLLLCILGFSQKPEENGIIYIKHPYIDVVNQTTKAYVGRDMATNKKLYADTAHFWISGMKDNMPIGDAMKMWDTDFNFYDSIKVTTVGYPDYLHYKDKDQKWVQSWWIWHGKSKKTGQWIDIDFVQFDGFNKDGKIIQEFLYGDFSKMVKE